MTELKKCSKCGEEKRLENFHLRNGFDSAGIRRRRAKCKACLKSMICIEDRRKRDRERKRAKGLTEDQRKRKRERAEKWRKSLSEEERQRIRDRMRICSLAWHNSLTEDDRKRRTEQARERRRAKMQTEEGRKKFNEQVRLNRAKNPLWRLKSSLRCRINSAVKGGGFKKSKSMGEWLGCDYEALKKHFESKFWPGMTWDNYGEWHVDHIKPLASAKTIEDVYRLNHYTNLQPLWKDDNFRKGAKQIEVCPMNLSIAI